MCGLMFIQNTAAAADVIIFQQNFIKDVSVGKYYLSIFFLGMFTIRKKTLQPFTNDTNKKY